MTSTLKELELYRKKLLHALADGRTLEQEVDLVDELIFLTKETYKD